MLDLFGLLLFAAVFVAKVKLLEHFVDDTLGEQRCKILFTVAGIDLTQVGIYIFLVYTMPFIGSTKNCICCITSSAGLRK